MFPLCPRPSELDRGRFEPLRFAPTHLTRGRYRVDDRYSHR